MDRRLARLTRRSLQNVGIRDITGLSTTIAVELDRALQEHPGVSGREVALRTFANLPTIVRSMLPVQFPLVLAGELDLLLPTSETFEPILTSTLLRFSEQITSRHSNTIRQRKDEETVRQLLTAKLEVYGICRLESTEGSGRTDIWFRSHQSSVDEIIEVKVPDDKTQYEDGWTELLQYCISSGSPYGHYFVTDVCRDLEHPRFMETRIETRDAKGIRLIGIRNLVSASYPSKVGTDRRKQTKNRPSSTGGDPRVDDPAS